MPDEKNFILLFEEGSMAVAKEISEEHMREADNGCLEIIRLADLHQYIGDGEWEAIEDAAQPTTSRSK